MGPSKATSAKPTPASCDEGRELALQLRRGRVRVRVDDARLQPGHHARRNVERSLRAADAEHDVAIRDGRDRVGGPSDRLDVPRRIGIEPANVDPRGRQVGGDPATGLTQPEDRNPPQARRLLPLLNIDSVHRTGVRETYPRVRQNC